MLFQKNDIKIIKDQSQISNYNFDTVVIPGVGSFPRAMNEIQSRGFDKIIFDSNDKNKKIYLIDSQDAVIGNPAYDLASLIDDVRYKSSNLLKKKIYSYFLQKSKKIDRKSFQNDFLILSVLRNLKILGIFTRLAKRDKKNNYLKLIPYTWKLIKLRTSGNNIFDELVSCLNNEK